MLEGGKNNRTGQCVLIKMYFVVLIKMGWWWGLHQYIHQRGGDMFTYHTVHKFICSDLPITRELFKTFSCRKYICLYSVQDILEHRKYFSQKYLIQKSNSAHISLTDCGILLNLQSTFLILLFSCITPQQNSFPVVLNREQECSCL